MYLPGLKNSMADALSRQPAEVDCPDDIDIEDSGGRPRALQHPVVFAAIEGWLKVVVPYLVLAGCIKVMKTVLLSGRPVVALACKRCSRQYLDSGEYANWRHTTPLCIGCSHKRDVASQVQGNPLAALGCQLKDNGLWLHIVPICRT